MQISLKIPESMANKLARVVRQDEKAVEQVAVERLADALRDVKLDLPHRYAEILGIIDSPHT